MLFTDDPAAEVAGQIASRFLGLDAVDGDFLATESQMAPMSPEPTPCSGDDDVLQGLIGSGPWKLHCPRCQMESDVRGPFDLDALQCPSCLTAHYPFLLKEGRCVDLERLRTFLINVYFRKETAIAVLRALGKPGPAAKALELDLPPRLVLGHALASLLVHVEAEYEHPYAHYLMGILFPLLPWAFRTSNRDEVAGALRCAATAGVLARKRFDPAMFPFPERLDAARYLPGLKRLLELFHVGELEHCLRTTDHEGYTDSLGEIAQEWSLAIDRLRKCVGIESEPRDLAHWDAPQNQAFARAIAARALQRQPHVLQRVFDLSRIDSQAQPGGSEASRSGSPGESATLIETINYRTGGVLRTALHVTSSCRMIGVTWQVLERLPSGSSFGGSAGEGSAEADLCHAEIVQERGSRWDEEFGRTVTSLGPPLAALCSVVVPVTIVYLLGVTGWLCLIAVQCRGILRSHYRRWFRCRSPSAMKDVMDASPPTLVLCAPYVPRVARRSCEFWACGGKETARRVRP